MHNNNGDKMKALLFILILFSSLVFGLAFVEEITPTTKINFSKDEVITKNDTPPKITSFLVFPTSVYKHMDKK